MRILVDTTHLYALMGSRAMFNAAEREFLAERNADVVVSAVSIWEMRLKYGSRHRSGARKNPFDPQRVLEALTEVDVSLLPLTAVHAACTLDVPLPHKDPFDELLLAQAQAEGLLFLTKDGQLGDHPLAIAIP